MADFPVHTPETAPEPAREAMKQAKQGFGFVPNLLGIMAEAPTVPGAYLQVHQAFEGTSLSPVERQVVLLATSYENACHYCMAAHTGVAKQAGASDDVVDALRSGRPLADDRLEALRSFTVELVRERGWVSDEAVDDFLDAGYERRQVLEVILGVTQKTLSNYVNHVAETPVDEAFQDFAWEKEDGATAAAAD